eukprot:409047-Pyramimonas_sp.AAC.1
MSRSGSSRAAAATANQGSGGRENSGRRWARHFSACCKTGKVVRKDPRARRGSPQSRADPTRFAVAAAPP